MHLMGTEIPGVYSEVLLYSNYYPHNEIKVFYLLLGCFFRSQKIFIYSQSFMSFWSVIVTQQDIGCAPWKGLCHVVISLNLSP